MFDLYTYVIARPIVDIKAWFATYFDLPHSQLHNLKAVCNRTQLAYLMVATCNRKFIK